MFGQECQDSQSIILWICVNLKFYFHVSAVTCVSSIITNTPPFYIFLGSRLHPGPERVKHIPHAPGAISF